MCPEPGLISAFVDDEVPSPWKERLAAHLAACPACAAREGSYRELRQTLHAPARPSAASAAAPAFDEAAVLARLGARLEGRLEGSAPARGAGEGATPSRQGVPATRGAGASIWNRRLPVPMPLAMAAAAALVFLAGLAFAGFLRPTTASPIQSLAAAQIAPNPAQPSSMEALINYLETQDAKVNLTIQLPSGATLDSSGKPFVMRASDANYTGTGGK